jgi:hypothetical protein
MEMNDFRRRRDQMKKERASRFKAAAIKEMSEAAYEAWEKLDKYKRILARIDECLSRGEEPDMQTIAMWER